VGGLAVTARQYARATEGQTRATNAAKAEAHAGEIREQRMGAGDGYHIPGRALL
jgi:hypothetical protein